MAFVYDEYLKNFENLLSKYRDVVEDRALFNSCMERNSAALVEAEQKTRRDITTLFKAVIIIAKKFEEDCNSGMEDHDKA